MNSLEFIQKVQRHQVTWDRMVTNAKETDIETN